jgi:hypothetical protein
MPLPSAGAASRLPDDGNVGPVHDPVPYLRLADQHSLKR